jgi:hypothetical protein
MLGRTTLNGFFILTPLIICPSFKSSVINSTQFEDSAAAINSASQKDI